MEETSPSPRKLFLKIFLKPTVFLFVFLLGFVFSFFLTGFKTSLTLIELFFLFFTFLPFLILGGFFLGILIFFKPNLKPKKQEYNLAKSEKIDFERRLFLKTLGSLGLGAFLFSLLNRKALGMSFGGTGLTDPIGIKHFSGNGADYSLTLTNADTAYQCPASGNLPNKDYILNVYNGSQTDIFWGWTNNIASNSNLRRLLPAGGNLFLDMPANGYIYLVCGSESKTIAYGIKERN